MNSEAKQSFGNAWFKERAIKSLKRIADGVWDFSDSLLLYTSAGSDIYEQLQETDSPYYKMVTAPEREYLQSIARDVVSLLPQHFDYIDLGPGTEHKEQFFFDEIKKQGKTFTYLPVDISEHFLAEAQTYGEKQGIDVCALRSSFEQLSGHIANRHAPRFVSLGLTFSNYQPQDAIGMVQTIAGENGRCFMNAQMRDRVDMTALQSVYQADAVNMADEKLLLLGLNPQHDVSERVADDGFQVWCTVQRTNALLDGVGVKEGDRLLVFQSLRYTKTQLQDILKALPSHQTFDTGSSFIATMIRTS